MILISFISRSEAEYEKETKYFEEASVFISPFRVRNHLVASRLGIILVEETIALFPTMERKYTVLLTFSICTRVYVLHTCEIYTRTYIEGTPTTCDT